MNHIIFLYLFLFKVLIIFSPIFLHSSEIEKNVQKNCFLSDEFILENFFRNRLDKGCAGYVLFGSKPVYLENPGNEKNMYIGTEQHKNSCETREVFDILKNCNITENQTNYVLHVSNPSINKNIISNEFLLVNRNAFLKAVNENLILFQYTMGLNVSAESLLTKLLDKNENISTLFKGKTALLGIILGYGAQNSVSYERGSSIAKSALANSSLSPPYRTCPPALDQNDVIEKCKTSSVLPGFGYDSVSDEVEDLVNSIADPTYDYRATSTKIAFSYLKDSDESEDLLSMYEKAQNEVEKTLHSDSFLDDVLAKFNIKLKNNDENTSPFQNDRIVKMLPNLVARSIWEDFSEIEIGCENSSYLDFISGMKEAEKLESCSHAVPEAYDDVLFFDDYRLQLSFCPQIKTSLESSRSYFKAISDQADIVCVEPLKIYYKVIKDGSGKEISNKTDKVSMHYLIKDIEGKTLAGSYSQEPARTFEISKLMPGLVYGLQGMKKNEIREVFIHQDFSYGMHSDFSGGKALSVRVELTDIKFSPEETNFPLLIPIDLLPLQGNSINSKKQLEFLRKKYISFCGFRTWLHYKKAAKFFTLNDILEDLNKIQENVKLLPSWDESSRKILRRFDLFLYSESST